MIIHRIYHITEDPNRLGRITSYNLQKIGAPGIDSFSDIDDDYGKNARAFAKILSKAGLAVEAYKISDNSGMHYEILPCNEASIAQARREYFTEQSAEIHEETLGLIREGRILDAITHEKSLPDNDLICLEQKSGDKPEIMHVSKFMASSDGLAPNKTYYLSANVMLGASSFPRQTE